MRTPFDSRSTSSSQEIGDIRTAAQRFIGGRQSRPYKACMFQFQVDAVDTATGARAGRWTTPHGVVETPAFMPVGTRGSVKGVWPQHLRATGAQMILANTYHLALRPGSEIV